MMCSSGSVKLLCALSAGASSTGLGTLPRRFWPVRWRFASQTYHRDKHVDECFQMQLTEVADRAEVRTVLAHNGHESQVAFAGQRNLAAGKHPHTIRIQQQADHHRRIERWGTARFVLVGGIEAA